MNKEATQPKRAPVCGLLSAAASVMCWLTIYVLVKYPNGINLHFAQSFPPFCAFCTFAFAIVAWARREKYWALPLISLLLALLLIGLICYAVGSIDEKG